MSNVSTGSRFSRRRVGGFVLGAAAFALLSLSPAGASANGGGSIALNALVCPDAVTAETAAETCDLAPLGGDITLTFEDGTMLTSSGNELNNGFVWGQAGDLPMGVYLIDWSGAEFPAGYDFYRYATWTGDIGGGLAGPYADLTPDQPNAFMSFVLIPATSDHDGDGVDDDVEIEQGSDPYDAASVPSQYAGCPPEDADGDGLTDCEEIDFYGTDPYSTDTDSDGLTDQEEIEVYGSDPFNADTDGDGAPDSDEIAFGSNPFDPADFPSVQAGPEAGVDSDGDGAEDIIEAAYGSDPFDANDHPRPTSAEGTSAAVTQATVTQLPNTGTGGGSADGSLGSIIAATLGAAALAVFGALANRRRA